MRISFGIQVLKVLLSVFRVAGLFCKLKLFFLGIKWKSWIHSGVMGLAVGTI